MAGTLEAMTSKGNETSVHPVTLTCWQSAGEEVVEIVSLFLLSV